MSGESVGFDMAELSSCYFCGAALDTALERHRVATTGGEETDVVVCPSCRRKLLAVLDRVLEADPAAESDSLLAAAVDGEGDVVPAAADPTGPGEAADDGPPVADVTPDQGVGGADLSPSVGDEGAAEVVDAAGDALAGDDETGGPDRTAADDDRGVDADASAGGSATAVGGDGDPIFGDGDTGDADGGTDDGTETDAPFGGGDDAGTESPATAAVRDAESGPEETSPVRDAEPDDDTGDSGAPTGDASGGDGSAAAPPDADTYNRVVRLLQNREFPVETAEIETVALNAYDIAPGDFRAVVDTAVDRGVLVEDGDQLRLPE